MGSLVHDTGHRGTAIQRCRTEELSPCGINYMYSIAILLCLTALADTGSKHGNLVQCLDNEIDLRLDGREHEVLLRAVDILRRHAD